MSSQAARAPGAELERNYRLWLFGISASLLLLAALLLGGQYRATTEESWQGARGAAARQASLVAIEVARALDHVSRLQLTMREALSGPPPAPSPLRASLQKIPPGNPELATGTYLFLPSDAPPFGLWGRTDLLDRRPAGDRELNGAFRLLENAWVGQLATVRISASYYGSAARDFHAFLPQQDWYRTVTRLHDRRGTPRSADAYLKTTIGPSAFELAGSARNPSRRPVWSPTYVDPVSGQLVSSLLLPVYVADQLIGVVGSDVEIGKLTAFLEQVRLPAGRLYIVGPGGTVVGGANLPKTVGRQARPPRLASLVSPKVNDRVRAAAQRPGTFLDTGEERVMVLPVGDTPWLAVFTARNSEVVAEAAPGLVAYAAVLSLLVASAIGALFAFRVRFLRPAASLLAVDSDSVEPAAIRGPWRPWAEVLARGRAEVRQHVKNLEAQNRFTQSIIGSALDCIVVIDENGLVLEWNPAAERTFGYLRTEALGRAIGDLIIPPEHHGAHTAGMARFLATGQAHVLGRRTEVDALKSDGSRIPIELAIAEAGTGSERRFTAALRDLSEIKKTRAKLEESEARLSAFFKNAPLTMFLKDSSGKFVLVNEQTARNLGTTPQALLGHTLDEVASEELASASAAADAEVLRTGRPKTEAQAFELATGLVHGLNTRFPVPDAEGNLTQIGGIFIDVTAQKRAEQELERSRDALYQSEKLNALGSLLAGVSHELNNPLAIVVGEAIMLEEDASGTEVASSAARIRKAAERCGRIVQSFLAMARQKPPERKPCDINQLVSQSLELAGYGLRSSGITVTTDFGEDLPPAYADPDQIGQVILNLIVNAQHALVEHGGARTLRLTTFTAKDAVVRLIVADDGPGIPPDLARRIFEPFFTTKPQGQGTGIGLSFSLGIAEANGGSLRLLPSPTGACFELMLPTANVDGVDTGRAEAAPTIDLKRRALVVDDEADLADMLARMVAGEGLEVEVAKGGAAALEALRAARFDLVISDLRMPDVDGPALHAWISKERPELVDHVGFVTGDTLGPAAAAFLKESGRPHMEKPFTRDDVRALLARIAPAQAA